MEDERQGRQRIGIFGGTFNPPHLGHLILAGESFEKLNLDLVLWVLTPLPPHKPLDGILDWKMRLQMVKATIDGIPYFQLSSVDIDRSPPYSAVDTVRLLKNAYPTSELFYLMGKDSLRDLPTWHHPREFVDVCDWIAVMERSNVFMDMEMLDRKLPGVKRKTVFVNMPIIEISSTQIRERISTGHVYQFFLPKAVYEIIRKNGLYRKGSD